MVFSFLLISPGMKRGGVKEEILEMKSFIDFNCFH